MRGVLFGEEDGHKLCAYCFSDLDGIQLCENFVLVMEMVSNLVQRVFWKCRCWMKGCGSVLR